MKFNYKLSRLCGTCYGSSSSTSGGGASSSTNHQQPNVVFHPDGTSLYSPIGNRVQHLDLIQQTLHTLGFQTRSDISRMAIHPNQGKLLVVIDRDGYALLVSIMSSRSTTTSSTTATATSSSGSNVVSPPFQNKHVCVVLHRFKFRRPVTAATFSPRDGKFLAVAMERTVELWFTPTKRKEFAPFVLHRAYSGCSKPMTHLEFSIDASVFLASSEDQTIKIWSTHQHKNFQSPTLAGHRDVIVGAFFFYQDYHNKTRNQKEKRIAGVYTVSRDGAIFTYEVSYDHAEAEENNISNNNGEEDQMMDAAVDFFSGGGRGGNTTTAPLGSETKDLSIKSSKSHAQQLIYQQWKLVKRHFVHPEGATNKRTSGGSGSTSVPRREIVTTASLRNDEHTNGSLLVIGWSSGLFGIYDMPNCSNIHTLSIGGGGGSNNTASAYGGVSTIALNATGEWTAFGCANYNQLLVWEWKSESYVIKQSSHSGGTRSAMSCMAYSPDSTVIATGGYDCKLKLWNTTSGFCFVTFGNEHHKGPITDIVFANPTVVVTSSLDGTVRAFDLIRYRNFKTMSLPNQFNQRIQFNCVAVDPSGEVVASGTTACGNYDIYLWNLQTGQILDRLSGHTGPVSSINFNPIHGSLISTSWDGTAKVWDVFKKDASDAESFPHKHDVVCSAIRPDGKVVCCGTIGGSLYFWQISDGTLLHMIDGQKDISGGRKVNDRMTSKNNASSRYFTSVCFSADGQCVLAGGNSKYICIYEVSQQILLKKFQFTYNRSLDGVLDELHSQYLTDGGPMDPDGGGGTTTTNGNKDDLAGTTVLPGAKRVDDGGRKHKVEVLTTNVSFSSTGRDWAVVSGEGLHIYSLDDDMVFDPISLLESMTPSAVITHLHSQEYSKALIMSLHLNESELVQQVLDSIPYSSIPHVVQSVGVTSSQQLLLERLMQYVTTQLSESCHVEYYVEWCLQLLQIHGQTILQKNRSKFMRCFRSMFQVLQTKYTECKTLCDSNRYTLDFIVDQGQLIGGTTTTGATSTAQ